MHSNELLWYEKLNTTYIVKIKTIHLDNLFHRIIILSVDTLYIKSINIYLDLIFFIIYFI